MSMGYIGSGLAAAEDRWVLLAELMATSVQDFDGASVSGLAPSVQPAATRFVEAWRGYAGQSRDLATGMGGAVRATLEDTGAIDEDTQRMFDALDTRLGPAR